MKSTLMITAASLALTLASSNILVAADTGNAQGGTGIEESTAGQGATDKQGGTAPTGQMKGGPNSSDQGGTGIKASAEGKGATEKSTEDKGAPMGSKGGASAGNAPGGTGIETSSQGEGSKDKNTNN